ncbi:MAG: hypothetical protein BWY11_00778 [Firmicutes bacterium ADurb.Bin182]|nr:MAG: hypothetical protein BWY11_00778 [Firmicutes bacterium ADurb.Bin182]
MKPGNLPGGQGANSHGNLCRKMSEYAKTKTSSYKCGLFLRETGIGGYTI